MFTALVIVAVFLQVAIALGVYSRRKTSNAHSVFVLLNLTLACWAFTDYIAISIPQNSTTIYAIRAVISLVVIQNTLFYFFAMSFPGKKLKQVQNHKFILIYSTLVLALTQTPYLFTSVTIKNGNANPNPGPAIIFFVIHALITIVPGIVSLTKKYRFSLGVHRRQLQYILFASIILWFIVPVTNFAITLSAKTTLFVRLSPFYTLVFGALITYAIVAQKLFDLRAAVGRFVTYVFSVILLSLLFIIPSLLLIGLILHVHFSGTHLFESVGVTLFFAFLYSWARNRFNFATNRFFFRGYYEPQEVLNKLSDSLVHSIDVAYLKLNSAKILQDALKTKHFNYWSSGDPKDSEYIDLLNKLYGSRRKDDVLSLDDYEGDSSTAKELSKRNVALAVRLRTTRNEELGYITLGFKESGDLYTEKDKRLLEIAADEIAISLQNALHFEEIKHFNLTLQERINIATKQLRASNVKLKALDETKDDFISMASHQLRTPLTSVKGYLSMVLDGDAGTVTPTQRKMLSQAFISSQRMVYMIADLLNVSRLKTGKFIIEFSPINLADIVQEEVNQLVETAQSREVALDYVKPSNFPITMLDETKIRQVIMNFMDNAIYYTPAGGNIKISLNDEHGSISFRVTDSGIGVPRDEQHHLFTKFYRASNAQKARPDGTGLGLFMAKKVVATQGGSILFESQEGKGSTFGFIFSKAKLQEQADQQSADKAKIPLLAK